VMIIRAIITWSVWVGMVHRDERCALIASSVRVMIGRFDESIHPRAQSILGWKVANHG
jgi:hypothetical protein